MSVETHQLQFTPEQVFEEVIPREPICLSVSDEETILKARQMTANYYLKRGFVEPTEVDTRGVIDEQADPYVDHSSYYVLMNPDTSELIATSRKIRYDEEKGMDSFPVLSHKNELDPDRVQQINDLGLENVVEISALVKNPELDHDKTATLKLYRRLFQDAWSLDRESSEKAFVMACNPVLFQTFQGLFNGSIQRIGPDLDYPGQKAVPAMLDMRAGPIELIERAGDKDDPSAANYAGVLEFMFEGLNANAIDQEIVEALKNNGLDSILAKMSYEAPIATTDAEELVDDKEPPKESGGMVELLHSRKPELAGTIGLLAITGLRTYGVAKGMSPDSDIDWQVFLGIEVATTPQYVFGLGTLARSSTHPENYTRAQRLRAAFYAGSALVAPYAYVAAEGEGVSTNVWAGAGAIAVACSIGPIKKIYRSLKKNNNTAEQS
jgi:hypothetical protein